MGGGNMNQRKAFTLMELMIVVVIAAIVFTVSMSDGAASAKAGVDEFRGKLESDLSYARSLSLADPSDPVIVRIDPALNKYWLARESEPDTPIVHPLSKKDYVVETGSGASGALKRVNVIATTLGDDGALAFDHVGVLKGQTPAILRLYAGRLFFDIEVSLVHQRAELHVSMDDSLVATVDGRLLKEADVDDDTVVYQSGDGGGGDGGGLISNLIEGTTNLLGGL